MTRKHLCHFLAFLSCLASVGCSGPILHPTGDSAPLIQPIVAPHHAARVITYCPAITEAYPTTYFKQANALMANLIDQAVTVNQDGIDVFVNYVNAESYLPQSSPLTITVPALPADPPLPVLTTPTPTGNPYTDGAAKNKAEQTYSQALAANQAALKQARAHLASVQQKVHQQTNQLRQLPAGPIAQVPTNIVGCLARAGDHDSVKAGEHWTIIASDILGDSDSSYVPIPALKGSRVAFIFTYCAVNTDCSAEEQEIHDELISDGVVSVTFYDTSVSTTITSLF